MTTQQLLAYLRPDTLARLAAELITDEADELDTGEFNFRTEAARRAYALILDAGCDNAGETDFFNLIEIALDLDARHPTLTDKD